MLDKIKSLPDRYRSRLKSSIREKAINKAKTRIMIAGRQPEDFSPDELEVIVKEEEDEIYSNIKEKGLLTVAGMLGLGWWL